MAQTKTQNGRGTRAAGTARRSNRSNAGSTSKKANGSSGARTTGKSGARTTGKTRSPRSRPTAPRSKPTAASTRTESVTEEGQEQSSTLSEIASKAKTPLMAGGAAVAGLVGGIALARNGRSKGISMPKLGSSRKKSRSSISLPKMSLPKLGGGESAGKALRATAEALGSTAKEIGKAGYRVGELTSEVRRVREQASAND